MVSARVADLPLQSEVAPAELLAPWKDDAFVRGVDPPTWRLADTLRSLADGARIPSAHYAGGINLVLWRWNEAGGPRVTWLDPNRELSARP